MIFLKPKWLFSCFFFCLWLLFVLYANRVVEVEVHKVGLICILGLLYPSLSDSLGSLFWIWSKGVVG